MNFFGQNRLGWSPFAAIIAITVGCSSTVQQPATKVTEREKETKQVKEEAPTDKQAPQSDDDRDKEFRMNDKVVKTDAEWRELLTEQQYDVTRQAGTERRGTGEYAYTKDEGIYKCVCCGLHLFASDRKFESGTGWPSFDSPVLKNNVTEKEDRGLFSVRTEVICSRCDAHLGHVFSDGPQETTGLRYCMNSAALKFDPKKKEEGSK